MQFSRDLFGTLFEAVVLKIIVILRVSQNCINPSGITKSHLIRWLFSLYTIKFLDYTDILILVFDDETQTKSIKYKKTAS
ncbi:MAG: hypothetical protein BGO87_07335 [Flavobacteriia bacterium 40-80]|nr:MAG: hypothetical protein BGO87_07335 [Flavobacteriia bacterium 40-80]